MSLSLKTVTEFTEKYYVDIYKFCCVRIGSSEAARDLTQDVFTLFSIKRRELIELNIRAWLYKVADNKCKQYLSAPDNCNLSIEDLQDIPIEDKPYDDFPFSEKIAVIMSILSDEEKQLFSMLYLQNKKASVVAMETGVDRNTVYKRKSRMLKKIKSNLKYSDFLTVFLLRFFACR